MAAPDDGAPRVCLDDLDDDVMTRVLSFLHPHELGRFAGTSRRNNALALSEDLWRPLCATTLGAPASTRAAVPAATIAATTTTSTSVSSGSSRVLKRQPSRGPDAVLHGGPSYRRFRDRAAAFMANDRPALQRDAWQTPGTDPAALRPIARDVAIFVLPSFHVAVCICMLWWYWLACGRAGTPLQDGAWWTPAIWAGTASTAAFLVFTGYAWLLARGSCVRLCGHTNARFPVCLRRAQRWCCLGRRMLTPAAIGAYVEPFSPVPLTMAQTNGTHPSCYVVTCAVVLASLGLQAAALVPAVFGSRLQPAIAAVPAASNVPEGGAAATSSSPDGTGSASAFDADLQPNVPVPFSVFAWRVAVLCVVGTLFLAAHFLPAAWSFFFHARRAPHAPVRQRSPGFVHDHCCVLTFARVVVIVCLLAFARFYAPPAEPASAHDDLVRLMTRVNDASQPLAGSRVVVASSTDGSDGDAYLVLPSGRILQRVKHATPTFAAPTKQPPAAPADNAATDSTAQPSAPSPIEVEVDAGAAATLVEVDALPFASTAAPATTPSAPSTAEESTQATSGAPTASPPPMPTPAPSSLITWYHRIRALVGTKPTSTLPQDAAAATAATLAPQSAPSALKANGGSDNDSEFDVVAAAPPSSAALFDGASKNASASEFGTMDSIVIDVKDVVEHGSFVLFYIILILIALALAALCSAITGAENLNLDLGGGGWVDRSDCGCLFRFLVPAVRLPFNIGWFIVRNSVAWVQWAAGHMWQALLHPTQHLGTIAIVLGVLLAGTFALGPRRFVWIFVAGVLFYSGSELLMVAGRFVFTGLGLSFLLHLPLVAYFVLLVVDSRRMLPRSNPELGFLPAQMRPLRLGNQIAWKAPVIYSVAAGAVFLSSLRYDWYWNYAPLAAFIQYVLTAWVCTYLLWLVLAAFLSGLAFIHDSACFWPPVATDTATTKFQTSLADSVTVWPDARYRAPSALAALHAANGATIDRVPQFHGAQGRPERDHLADFTT